jgi:formylglycine-generating enzyme required for sulfatase activity
LKRYGLFVGVNDYRDVAIENLRCAVQDATSLSGLFEHRLDFAECAVLTNPRASEVTDRLEQFQARLQPGDLFVFYFAGHGKSHVNGHVLLLNDCRLNTLGDPHPVGILGVKSLRSLTDEWTGVSRALIFDACRRSLRGARDGGEGSGFNGPGWRDCLTTKGVKANASPAQRQFGALNSCQDEGLAVELERHGVFTQALMDVVKVRADAGRGVALDAAMVAAVGQRMDALCQEAGHALGQRPEHTGDAVELMAGRSAPAATVNQPQPGALAPGADRPKLVIKRVRPIPTTPDLSPAAATYGALKVFKDAFKDGTGEGPAMIWLPQGSFLMGSPETELGRDRDEGPQHQVHIRYPLAVGQTAVTFDEFDAFVADTNYEHKPNDQGWGRGQRPVINVSWHDAQAYAKWLSQKTGEKYRLLSEAEWEYAARAGTSTAFWWGNSITTDQANYDGNQSYNGSPQGEYRKKTLEVHSFQPNPWGLYQVHGNVWEWVQDKWHGSYEGAPVDGSAWEAGGGEEDTRVLRGGSWVNNPRYLRAAGRNRDDAGDRFYCLGFRLARTVSS